MKKKVLAALLFGMTGAAVMASGVCADETEALTEGQTEAVSEQTEAPIDAPAWYSGEIVEPGERPDYEAGRYVTLGQYKGLTVVLDGLEVTDEEIDAYIESAAAQAGLNQAEGTVKEGDVVNIDYTGKKDGVAFDGGTAQGAALEIGSGTFIPGFEEGLIGVNTGDTVDLNLTFPENYGAEELAGAETVFTVTINYIEVSPEMNDELALQLTNGEQSTMEAYRAAIREDMEQQKTDGYLEDEVLTQIYNTCIVNEYPEEIVNYALTGINNGYVSYAQAYDMSLEEFLKEAFGYEPEDYIAEAEAYVEQELYLELVLKAIAEKEGIGLTEEQYQAGLENILKFSPDFASPEELEEYYGRDVIESNLLMDNVVEMLIAEAQIVEKSEETEAESTETEELFEGAQITDADAEAEETEAETESAETEPAETEA